MDKLTISALQIAHDFMSGFEDDENQESILEKLTVIRVALQDAKGSKDAVTPLVFGEAKDAKPQGVVPSEPEPTRTSETLMSRLDCLCDNPEADISAYHEKDGTWKVYVHESLAAYQKRRGMGGMKALRISEGLTRDQAVAMFKQFPGVFEIWEKRELKICERIEIPMSKDDDNENWRLRMLAMKEGRPF